MFKAFIVHMSWGLKQMLRLLCPFAGPANFKKSISYKKGNWQNQEVIKIYYL